MLEELLKILDFKGNNPDLRLCIESLIERDLGEEIEELIYDVASYAYELGQREG